MTETISQINKEKIAFWFLVSIFLICAGFYMYCINATVRNVVAREKAEEEAGLISLQISGKEFQYISMKNSITLDSAHILGFKNVDDKVFLNKNTNGTISYLPSF